MLRSPDNVKRAAIALYLIAEKSEALEKTDPIMPSDIQASLELHYGKSYIVVRQKSTKDILSVFSIDANNNMHCIKNPLSVLKLLKLGRNEHN